MLIGQSSQLELFQWFVRANVESSSGHLANAGASTEAQAASQAGQDGARP
jgi:starvation-inducible DNA-binding protein